MAGIHIWPSQSRACGFGNLYRDSKIHGQGKLEMIRRVSKHTLGVILAIAFALFMVGLAIISAMTLTAFIGNMK